MQITPLETWALLKHYVGILDVNVEEFDIIGFANTLKRIHELAGDQELLDWCREMNKQCDGDEIPEEGHYDS